MELTTNDLIFYSGLGLAALSLVIAILYFIYYKFRKEKLANQLLKEYGEPPIQSNVKKSRGKEA